MDTNRRPEPGRTLPALTRRRFLVTSAGALTLGVAGCSSPSEMTNQIELEGREFEASPVGLPGDAQREVVMSEVARDSLTTSRTIDQADGELAFTSEYAVYDRGAARREPTLVEAFLGRASGTRGSVGASVVPPSADPFDHATPLLEPTSSLLDVRPSAAAEYASLVVPAGARRDGGVALDRTLLLLPSDALPEEATIQTGGFAIPSTNWFPGEMWLPNEHHCPDSRWIPSTTWLPGEPSDLSVVVPLGEQSPEGLFGESGGEVRGERLEAGDALHPWDPYIVAIPGSVALRDDAPFAPPELLDGGFPAPTGGGTYGVGVLATPDVSVAGQSVNPLTGASFEELLASDAVERMLVDAGIADGESVEWLGGPGEVSVPDRHGPLRADGVGEVSTGRHGPMRTSDVTMFGEEAEATTMAGVVEGASGPWAVVLNVARARPDDVVVAISVQRTPVRSANVGWMDGLLGGEAEGTLPLASAVVWMGRGAWLSAMAYETLDHR